MPDLFDRHFHFGTHHANITRLRVWHTQQVLYDVDKESTKEISIPVHPPPFVCKEVDFAGRCPWLWSLDGIENLDKQGLQALACSVLLWFCGLIHLGLHAGASPLRMSTKSGAGSPFVRF